MKYTLLVVCLSFGFIHLSLADGSDVAQRQEYELRFVFPFYPKELDILIGHLQTKLYRVQQSLESCEAINTGNHEAGSNVISINDKGDVSDPPEGRVDKLKVITTLREEIRAAEAKLEICRFHFWTGKSKGESAK